MAKRANGKPKSGHEASPKAAAAAIDYQSI